MCLQAYGGGAKGKSSIFDQRSSKGKIKVPNEAEHRFEATELCSRFWQRLHQTVI